MIIVDCFNEAMDNMDKFIKSRLAKVMDIDLELATLGRLIKSKLIQSMNEFQLNRHYSGRAYKSEAVFYKLKARAIYEQKQILLDEAKKLERVKLKFELCKTDIDEKIKQLEEQCSIKDEQLNEIWRNRVVNQKLTNKSL